MLNHSHPGSRFPFLHGLHHAAEAVSQEPRDRATAAQGRMDPPSSSGQPATQRRQLQGPRPPRLNVRAESHAIKKPAGSGAPVPAQGQGRRGEKQQQPPRAPVIMYDASPKVIHANPSEFMALVQRLTGPGSWSGEAPPAEARGHQTDDDAAALGHQCSFLPPELLLSPSAAMSPAARLATIERSVRPMPGYVPDGGEGLFEDGTLASVLGPARPGILSPLPSSLPPAAPGLFPPLQFDASCISWLNELSPILRAASTAGAGAPSFGAGAGGASNGASRPPPPPSYYSEPFVPSPRNLLATPTVPSPATFAEFFGSLPDF